MKTKCHSVKLMGLNKISPKCYKAISFDGATDFIPASCVFGPDLSIYKSDAYWIAAWILPLKKIQWSDKKTAWFDPVTGQMQPHIEVIKHKPKMINPTESNPDASLIR